LLARLTSERGEPFLPEVGQLYRVNTVIYTFGHDPAPARPAVVLCVPPSQASKSPIRLVTRTSKPARGIKHPADKSLGLDRDGTFSVLVSVEQQLWRPENVELLGVLSDPYLNRVIERFDS
jgi:hypothetical protein